MNLRTVRNKVNFALQSLIRLKRSAQFFRIISGRSRGLSFILCLLTASLLSASLQKPTSPQATIVLDAATRYQTISGWEATAQAGQAECLGFANYAATLFDLAANDLGINRLRLEIRSGAENPVDYFTQWLTGIITFAVWKNHRYEIQNDNDNPMVINPLGFQFTGLDHTIDHVVLPMKQRVEANGEHLYINLNYVDFGSSAFEHKDNPAEYAEFVLATYQHLQSKYGWVPDAWEVILEPDTSAASWSGTQIGNALAAAGSRLQANGFTPNFIAPSPTNMANAVPMFDSLAQVTGATSHVSELSYHRYAGVSDANLQAIAAKAAQYHIGTAMLEHIGSDYLDLHKDLQLANNVAWQQYTIAFCTGDDGAQYYLVDSSNPSNPVITMGSRTKFLRQYFKYVRSGAVRIGASSNDGAFDPLAFINANGKPVVVVKATAAGSFGISGLPAGTYGIKYTTGSQYNIDLADVVLTAGQTVNTSIPASGVITIYAKTLSATATPTSTPTSTPTGTPTWTPSDFIYLPIVIR